MITFRRHSDLTQSPPSHSTFPARFPLQQEIVPGGPQTPPILLQAGTTNRSKNEKNESKVLLANK